MTKTDRIIGVVFLLICGGMVFSIVTMQHPNFDRDPGPTFVPLIYTISLFVCALGLLFFPSVKKKSNEDEEKPTPIKKENTIKMIVLFIALAMYVILFKPLGFVISTLLFLVFACYYLAPEKNFRLIINSLIITLFTIGIVYYVLKMQLNIQLPKGVFF